MSIVTWNIFNTIRILNIKLINGIIKYYNGDYLKVNRMNNTNTHLIYNIYMDLYNLTYKPTYVIDNIYIGNAYNASNYYDLIDMNIGLIINITDEIPNFYEKEFTYYNIFIKDNNNAHILPYIDNMLIAITKFQQTNVNKNILIHCYMGSSRSASLVVAYLSYIHMYTIKDSINFLKTQRPIININTTFIDDLNKWETVNKSI